MLVEDETAFHSPHLDWKKLTRFHGPALISLLRAELKKEPNVTARASIWELWDSKLNHISEFFYKGGNVKLFWNTWCKYPVLMNDQGKDAPLKEVLKDLKDWKVFYPPILEHPEIQLYIMVSTCFSHLTKHISVNAHHKSFHSGRNSVCRPLHNIIVQCGPSSGRRTGSQNLFQSALTCCDLFMIT